MLGCWGWDQVEAAGRIPVKLLPPVSLFSVGAVHCRLLLFDFTSLYQLVKGMSKSQVDWLTYLGWAPGLTERLPARDTRLESRSVCTSFCWGAGWFPRTGAEDWGCITWPNKSPGNETGNAAKQSWVSGRAEEEMGEQRVRRTGYAMILVWPSYIHQAHFYSQQTFWILRGLWSTTRGGPVWWWRWRRLGKHFSHSLLNSRFWLFRKHLKEHGSL